MSATHSIHALAQFIVDPTCETHDGLDVGQDDKRYILVPKTGVEKPKGIFSIKYSLRPNHPNWDFLFPPANSFWHVPNASAAFLVILRR